jgi:hypothetical protein
MRFLADWISFVGPRSQLASALNTRVAALEALRDPFELANIPLRRGDNEYFDLGPIDSRGHSTFFSSKAWVSDGPAGGIVMGYNGNLLFLGLREDLLRIAANQDFGRVLSYVTNAGSLTKTVQMHLTLRQFRDLRLPDAMLPRRLTEPFPGAPGRIRISLSGELHYTREGLVFGVLPVQHG